MRLDQLEQHLKKRRPVAEANIAAKIKDPAMIKRLGIAMRHDSTLPKASIAKLGPKPDDQSILALWSTMLDKSLSQQTTVTYQQMVNLMTGSQDYTSTVLLTTKTSTVKVAMLLEHGKL